MTIDKQDGGPAYPPFHDPKNHNSGMSLRDYFAGQVIASVKGWHPADKKGKSAAAIAYQIADAMIAERDKQ